MIYPTRTAVLAAAAGAPVALLVAVALPDRWFVGLAWPVAVLALTLIYALSGLRAGTVKLVLPPTAAVGATIDVADYGIALSDLVGVPVLAPGFVAQGAVLGELARLFGPAAPNTLANVSRSVLEGGPDGLAAAIQRAKEKVA